MPHTTEIPVTWGDTDAGGLIYFPRFFHYAVVGLNDYFAPAVETGHLMEALRTEGLVLPAVDASASFESPLRAGETARLRTTVRALGTSSLTTAFEVERAADGERAARVTVTFVLVDEQFESTALPQAIRDCVAARGDDPDAD
ncbi:MAG: acyl-CoA thioesterase [Haloarculaceae archaeon]